MAAAPTLGSATQESTQDKGAAQAEEGATQGVAEGEEVTPSPGSGKRAARPV